MSKPHVTNSITPAAGLSVFLARLMRGENLSRSDASEFLEALLSEGSTDGQIAAALVALAVKGETVDELTGIAAAMRSRAVPLKPRHERFLDTAGTGSSCAKTFNVSTAAAFVIAGAGLPVAKHGNRAVTSRSGSSDVLTALGVGVGASPEVSEKCLNDLGVCFMFAPLYHGTTARVAAIRRELGVRTVFNLLGPLTNPAGAPYQLVGVCNAELVEPIAQTLAALGTKRAWVVHGLDGLDEVTLADKTVVAEAQDGKVQIFELGPGDFGLRNSSLEKLSGGDADASARIIREVFSGRDDAARDLIVANAAAGLFVGGAATDLRAAAGLAATSIDTGAAAAKLAELVKATAPVITPEGERMKTGMDFMAEVVEKKRARLREAQAKVSFYNVRASAYDVRSRASRHALRNALSDGAHINVIAEIKRASPSKGDLGLRATVEETAGAYSRGGAVAVSVLTEEDYFNGSLADLRSVRRSVSLPVLRKDFVFDDYQVYEAAAAGADALLLIVALLDDETLLRLRTIAETELGMDALVEVHTGEEMARALASGASLIGVNNRNLHTFEVSSDVSFELRKDAPGALLVSESGLRTGSELKRLRDAGYNGFLIGEALVASENPESTLRAMITEAEE